MQYGAESWQKASVSPANHSPATGIVLLHWGGWGGGDRGNVKGLVAGLHRQYYVMSISYRLGTPADPSFEQVLEDIDAAVGWLRSKPTVRSDKVILWGYSAGAHLAMLYGYQHPDRVACVISESGVGDLRLISHLPETASLLGEGCPEGRSMAMSPLTYVCPECPPTLLLHGTEDTILPLEGIASTFERLRMNGVPCTVVALPGGHTAPAQWTARDAVVKDFLARSLQQEASRL